MKKSIFFVLLVVVQLMISKTQVFSASFGTCQYYKDEVQKNLDLLEKYTREKEDSEKKLEIYIQNKEKDYSYLVLQVKNTIWFADLQLSSNQKLLTMNQKKVEELCRESDLMLKGTFFVDSQSHLPSEGGVSFQISKTPKERCNELIDRMLSHYRMYKNIKMLGPTETMRIPMCNMIRDDYRINKNILKLEELFQHAKNIDSTTGVDRDNAIEALDLYNKQTKDNIIQMKEQIIMQEKQIQLQKKKIEDNNKVFQIQMSLNRALEIIEKLKQTNQFSSVRQVGNAFYIDMKSGKTAVMSVIGNSVLYTPTPL